MPSVFQTTPPHPALKARTTLYSLSVGGAEASQNGFGLLMPTKFVARFAMSASHQRGMNVLGGVTTFRHRRHCQVVATRRAVAPGPDLRRARPPRARHRDLSALERQTLRH